MKNLPIAKKGLEVDDHLLLLITKATPFNPRPEIISPPEPTTLAASKQTCKIKHHREDKSNGSNVD